MNINAGFKTVKSVITANSPVLLLGATIAGVVTTGVLAAKGGYRARGIIDEAQAEKAGDLDLTEKVQLTWLCYAAPAITGVTAIASAVGVHTIHTKRHAALAGLYAMSTTKLDDVREKAEELLGPKKIQQLNDETAQLAVDRNPVGDHEVIITGNGTDLCYDDFSGRYFMGSMVIMENAVNEINRAIIDDGEASLNDFYDHIGLGPIPMGIRMGWSGGDKVEARFGATKTPDGRSALSITFRNEPKDTLRKY